MNYQKINKVSGLLSISFVLLLLLAGGFVRSTGSGMGCPDWPKCFDGYIPPTDISQLPANYQDIHLQKRIKKVQKFANLLNKIGFKKESEKLLNDPSIYLPEEFNVRKAWTEYVNRIIGVLSGMFSLAFFLTLFKTKFRSNKKQFWFGVLGFFFMLFNGWLGSIVVATNLFSIIVSIHYLLAYAALLFFMLSVFAPQLNQNNASLLKYKWWIVFLLILSLVQILFGTQLRHSSDVAISNGSLYANNTMNLDSLGFSFYVHRALALVVIFFTAFILFKNKTMKDKLSFNLLITVLASLCLQYLSGVFNLRFQFPLIFQVLHIFLAGIIFTITVYLCQLVFNSKVR